MKLTKAQLRIASQVRERLDQPTLTREDVEYIYENYHEGSGGDVSANAAYFTPVDLAMDAALFTPKSDCHIVDIAAGIGVLSYGLLTRNYYGDRPIKSITLIELNPEYYRIGKRLLTVLSAYNESHTAIDINYINGNIFDQAI